ncbi:MAG TPA: hypothetical protein VFL55_03195 [Acetobacteraceae bacterium]|nr:hypothetical protein [Acetobacteraceae bacterium]
MKLQAFAQRQRPSSSVSFGDHAFHHLRLRLEGVVGPEQRVEHKVAMHAGDGGRRPVRINDGQIEVGDEAQFAVLAGKGDIDDRQYSRTGR